MAIIIGDLSQKGGVGKSTTSFDTAAALAEDEQNAVLLIDLDPQGHATEGIGLKDFWVREDVVTLYDAMLNLKRIDPQDLIQEVPGEKFFAVPSNFQMMVLDTELTSARSKETRLFDLLQVFKDAFTHIVIDSPSYFGNITDNVIRAVSIPIDSEEQFLLKRDPDTKELTKDSQDLLRSGLLIPIQAEQTSIRAFELLLNQIKVVEAELKIKNNILTLIPNLVQRSGLAGKILGEFRAILPDKMPSFDIPKRVVFQEAYQAGQSIFTYTPRERSKLKEVEEMRQCYRDLVKLLQERGEDYARKYRATQKY